jgi:hypothetical protein
MSLEGALAFAFEMIEVKATLVKVLDATIDEAVEVDGDDVDLYIDVLEEWLVARQKVDWSNERPFHIEAEYRRREREKHD